MATKYWKYGNSAVAQVATATFGTYDVATTRKITIGGLVISAADSGGTLTAALTALAALLNASTHPYFSGITWTSSATQIIGTADTAGVPFVFAGSVTGGTGTCSNAYTVTTASAGPNDWSTATNWSDNTVPVDGDTVIIKDSSQNICWGLDQSSINLASLRIDQSYTGKIGLDKMVFATSATGGTTVSTAIEYRTDYLTLDGATDCKIGENLSSAQPNGSQRIKINFGSTASTVRVYGSASASSEVGRPAIRVLANHASTNIYVHFCPGGFGLAADVPGETSTVGAVYVEDKTTSTSVFIGDGTTLAWFEQQGGDNVLQAAATVGTVLCFGGKLRMEGTFVSTLHAVYGGTCTDNRYNGGVISTETDLYGGVLDYSQTALPRTVSALFLQAGELIWDTPMTFTGGLQTYGRKFTMQLAGSAP